MKEIENVDLFDSIDVQSETLDFLEKKLITSTTGGRFLLTSLDS